MSRERFRKPPLNWLRQLNYFYRYTAVEPVSPRAAALYNYLLYRFSAAFWPDSALIPLASLSGACNMSRDSIIRARRELCERGIIEVEHRGANRPARYTLIDYHAFVGGNPEEIQAARNFLNGGESDDQ